MDLPRRTFVDSNANLMTTLYVCRVCIFCSFTKETLLGMGRLQELEMVDMEELERFDSDVFSHLNHLRSLTLETYPDIEKYRFRLGMYFWEIFSGTKMLNRLCIIVWLLEIHMFSLSKASLQFYGFLKMHGVQWKKEFLVRKTVSFFKCREISSCRLCKDFMSTVSQYVRIFPILFHRSSIIRFDTFGRAACDYKRASAVRPTERRNFAETQEIEHYGSQCRTN